MKKETIAVIMPAYNVGKYIHEAFDSLMDQTYPDWECWCVDDGSSDNTYQVMESYAKKDKRFHIFKQKNRGVTASSNFLLNQLDENIKYLYHLDSDDYIHPQTFEIFVALQHQTHADVVEGPSMRVFDEKPAEYTQKIDISELNMQIIKDMNVYLLKRTRKSLPNSWINKRNLYVWEKVKSLRFNEKLSYEDDYFYNSQVHTIIQEKALIRNAAFYFYRSNPTSLTQSVNYQKYQEACIARIYATYDYFIKGNRVPANLLKEFKKDIAQDCYRMIGLKPVRRCKDKNLKHILFQRACAVLSDLRLMGILDERLLPFYPRLMLWAFRCHFYYLVRFLSVFK